MKLKLTDRAVRAKKPPRKGQAEYWDTEAKGLALRVSYAGTKTWTVMTRIKGTGKQIRHKIGEYPAVSLAEARDQARQVKIDASKGLDPQAAARMAAAAAARRHRNTFKTVAADFVKEYVVREKNLRTGGEIEATIKRELTPDWGDRPIRDISRRDVKDLIRAKAAEAPIAANRLLAVTRKLFNWAVDEEIIDTSPAARITPPSPEVERERVLTDDEVRAIWRAGDALDHPFGALYQLLLATAQRRSEVAGMRWSEIDMRARTWTIPGDRAKSGKGHLVPLSSLAMEVIRSLPHTDGCEHVISSGRVGDKPVSGFSRQKLRCDKISGVTNWRVHDLRRTAATNMRSIGVDRLTVSKDLNHEESGVTKRYDRYAADPEKRKALERWGQKLRRIVRGRQKSGNVVKLHGGAEAPLSA